MPTTKVTPELSTIIRDLRKVTDTKSHEIANLINKSTGYISNLENCKTESINWNDVLRIFKHFINKSNDISVIARIEQFIDNDVKLDFSDREIRQQEKNRFYILFDKQYRMIKIPDKLIEYIKKEISELGITPIDIMNEFNANRDIDNVDDYEKNKLIIEFQDVRRCEIIVFDLDEEFLNDILDGKIKKTNYINLHGIMHSLQIIKGDSPEDAVINSQKILYDNGIYTLKERNNILKGEELKGVVSGLKYNKKIHIDESATRLPPELVQYYNVFDDFIDELEFLKDKDTMYLTNTLISLMKNLNNYRTTSMTLALLNISLKDFEKFNPDEQKAIFKEIKDFIDKKSRSSKEDFSIEKF